MHLAIDAVGNSGGGGLVVLRDMVRSLADSGHFQRITVFVSPGVKLPEIYQVKVDVLEIMGPHCSYPKRVVWYLHSLKGKAGGLKVNALLCMNGMGIGGHGIPTFHFVQQSLVFSDEAMNEFPRKAKIKFLLIRRLMKHSLSHSDGIFVQSPWMKKLLEHHIGKGVPIQVVIPETQPSLGQPAGPSTGFPRLLYVGSDSPHKNLKNTLEGFSILRRSIPEALFSMTLEETPGLAVPGTEFLGRLPRESLFDIYEHSTLLIMPSLVETVGLPLVEALSTGLPALAADRPYAHDVAGDAACYFDPHSPESFAEVAHSVLSSPQKLAGLRVAAARRFQYLRDLPGYRKLGDIVFEETKGSGARAKP